MRALPAGRLQPTLQPPNPTACRICWDVQKIKLMKTTHARTHAHTTQTDRQTENNLKEIVWRVMSEVCRREHYAVFGNVFTSCSIFTCRSCVSGHSLLQYVPKVRGKEFRSPPPPLLAGELFA